MTRQLIAKILFYGLLVLISAWSAWVSVLAPLACPVPNALLSQPGEVGCFEFWFARYQTLVAVVPVFVVIWLTWRQLAIAERQALSAFRERAAARYRQMDRFLALCSALDSFDAGIFKPSAFSLVDDGPYPSTPEGFEEFKVEIERVVRGRREVLRRITAAASDSRVSGEDATLVETVAAELKAVVDRADARIAQLLHVPTISLDPDSQLLKNTMAAIRRNHMYYAWWDGIDQAARGVSIVLFRAREAVAERQSQIVTELVSPPRV